jgi:hypothetical protein
MKNWTLRAIGMLAAFSCAPGQVFGIEWITGSGRSITENRTVPHFSGVKLRGPGMLYIEVHDAKESLSITGEDNVLPYLVAEMEDGVLVIGPKPNVVIEPRASVVYRVSLRKLDHLAVHGSGRVDATGVDSQRLKASIGGSGSVRISGRAAQQTLILNGSGAMDLRDLQGRSCELAMAGSGSAQVNASESLQVDLSGSGQVMYLGSPMLKSDVAGSGSVGPIAVAEAEQALEQALPE